MRPSDSLKVRAGPATLSAASIAVPCRRAACDVVMMLGLYRFTLKPDRDDNSYLIQNKYHNMYTKRFDVDFTQDFTR